MLVVDIFFDEVYVQPFCLFSIWLFSYYSVLRIIYIFWIQVFINTCSINIFPSSVVCLFILLIVTFTEQKIFTLIKFNLPISFSQIMIWVSCLKTDHQTQGALDFFSYLIFWKLCDFMFTFRLIICFNFCERCEVCVSDLSFFFCMLNVQFAEKHCPFSINLAFLLCRRSADCIHVNLCLGSVVCPVDLFIHLLLHH